MKQLSLKTFTILTLLPFMLHAEQGKIDMHGGKDTKAPSQIAPKKADIFYGKILEIKPAMGYKYLKIDENGTEIWVAIANAPVAIGDKVGYDKQTMMTNFKSKTLDQEFKEIFFASDVYLPQKVQRPKSMKEMLGLSAVKKDPHAGMGRGLSPVEENGTPAKAFVKKDAYTIEEIHMWRKALKDQIISIKGSVFKVSRNIMKLDWVHLGDGTGNEKKLTDDLVFTATNTTLKQGDNVIAKGKVIVDKDFGYGYFYKVIIQDASFKVQ